MGMKLPQPENLIEFNNRAQWRSWLEKNHATEPEAWLVIYKKKYKDEGLVLDDAVEEALCFGWIDGKLISLDDKRFTLRFTPRKPNSIWSMNNIQRVEKLIKAGKMTGAGHSKITEAKANGEWEAALRRERVDEIPKVLEDALRKIPGALSVYKALPNSLKKQNIYRLQSAKRDETKQRIVQEVINDALSKSKK